MTGLRQIDDTRIPMNARALLVVSTLALLPGCMSYMRLGYTRSYTLPITGAEGALIAPAIVATAEGMGLEAWSNGTDAQVTLEDGTRLYWYDFGQQYKLGVSVAQERPDLEVQLREIKVRADQIWELAVQARQSNNLGAAIVIPPPNAGPAGAEAAAPPVQRGITPNRFACTSSLDCQSGSCQSGRCAESAAPAIGGAGGPCSFDKDCPGAKCRFGECVGGAPGAKCSFGSDCPSGRCNFGKCE
ncbi:MAG: hypothetical protein IT380_27075 [Myxococcales bacterium]|nr:hypothetical protein [Myxococcales bacterium]